MWEEMKQQMSDGGTGMPVGGMEEIDLDGPTVQFSEDFTGKTSNVDFDMLQSFGVTWDMCTWPFRSLHVQVQVDLCAE